MGEKGNNSDKKFLFVNKGVDSTTLSRSEGVEASHILKFVQKKRPRRRRLAKNGKYDFVAFEQSGETATTQVPSRAIVNQGGDDDDAGSKTRRIITEISTLIMAATQESLDNRVSGSTFDPFNMSVAPLSRDMLDLLEYSWELMPFGVSGYKLDVVPKSVRPMTELYTQARNQLFLDVLFKEELLFPVLASSSGRMSLMINNTQAKRKQHEVFHQAAIGAVRKAAVSAQGDLQKLRSLMTGIHYLICCSGLAGRVDDCRTHIRAQRSLFNYLDTSNSLGWHQLDTCASFDTMNAIRSGDIPITKEAMSNPGQLTTPRLASLSKGLMAVRFEQLGSNLKASAPGERACSYGRHIESMNFMYDAHLTLSSSLGSSFETALNASFIRSWLQGTLREVLVCLTVAKVVWHATEHTTGADARWLCQRARSLLHDLLNIPRLQLIKFEPMFDHMECIRLALIIMMTCTLYRTAGLMLTETVTQLQVALIKCIDQDWNEADEGYRQPFDGNELLLWSILTGHFVTLNSNQSHEKEHWFAEQAARISIHRLHIHTYSDLHDLMTGYLYSWTHQESSLKKVANLITMMAA